MVLIGVAQSHEWNKPEYDQWYSMLQYKVDDGQGDPFYVSCCNHTDCTPIDDTQYKLDAGKWMIIWDGAWRAAPVIQRPKGIRGPAFAVLCVVQGEPVCFTPPLLV
jgi:hypothetical protein